MHPALQLSDVQTTIDFHLNHQDQVDTYCQRRNQQAQEIPYINEQHFNTQGLRERLLARKQQNSPTTD